MAENPRIEELRRRVQADPASIAFAALAEEYRRTGRFEEAIETCRTGLQRHPAYLSARVTLGRALLETGDYPGAREELDTVLRSAPDNLAALRGLEQIDERLGHSTEMHADLHEMMREPIRLAAERPPAPPPEPSPAPPPVAPEPPAVDVPVAFQPEPPRAELNLDSFDLSLSPAASSTEPAADAAVAQEGSATSTSEPFDIFAAALQPRPASPPVPVIAFEPSTIAFEAPALAPPVSPSEPTVVPPAMSESSFVPPAPNASMGEPMVAPPSVSEPSFPPPAPNASVAESTLAPAPAEGHAETPASAPSFDDEPDDSSGDAERLPDPHVAALVTRLERFLGAIESARHA